MVRPVQSKPQKPNWVGGGTQTLRPAPQPEMVWEMQGKFIDLDKNDFKFASISTGQG